MNFISIGRFYSLWPLFNADKHVKQTLTTLVTPEMAMIMYQFSFSKKLRMLCGIVTISTIIYFLSAVDLKKASLITSNKIMINSSSYFEWTINATLPVNRDMRSHPVLKRALTAEIYSDAISLMETFVLLCQKYNVTFIMAEGTLLGSYFFHDIIPWDDDLDVIVKYADRDRLMTAFKDRLFQEAYVVSSYAEKKGVDWYSMSILNGTNKETPPAFPTKIPQTKFTFPDLKCKVFKRFAKRAGKYKWTFPYIDIKYYIEYEKTISKVDRRQPQKYTYYSKDFYPLHFRPFGRLWLPAPKDTRLFLQRKFKTFHCTTGFWDHVQEKRMKTIGLSSCEEILSYYPHVVRMLTSNDQHGVLETLVLEDHVIHSVVVDEDYIKTNGYYSFT